MAFEQFFELPENKFGQGFVIQEYNDRWYVQEARRPKGDGTIYKSWMQKFKKKGELLCKDDGTPYVFPLGVEISEQAANAILSLSNQQDTGDEAPF